MSHRLDSDAPPVVRDPDLLRQLADIESRDPDGGETQPTTEDYDRHAAWAIGRYGQRVWDVYSRGGWSPENDPDW